MATLGKDYDEILEVIRSRQNRIYFDITLEIDAGGKLYSAKKINMIDTSERYIEDYCSDIVVEALFDYAEYFRFIFPQRKDAKVILTRRLMSELSDVEIPGVGDMVSVYRMVDIDNRDVDMQGLPAVGGGNAMFEASLALIELPIESLRMTRVSGIYYQSNGLDVLRYLLGAKSKELELAQEHIPVGVTVVPADTQDPREHVVIPAGTELLAELPSLLQRDCGGIYNHDIGIFLKHNMWYVYPLYNTKRYGIADSSVDVVVLPPNRSPGIERTYAVRGKSILISTTGEVRQKDVSDVDYLNNGNGVLYARATATWDYAEVTGNKATVSRAKNVAEIMSVSRQSRMQNAPFSSEKVTDNAAYQLSKLSKRRGYMVYLTWENSNPDILKPGMPIKLHVPVEGGSRESLGTLVGLESNSSPVSSELLSRRYNTNTILQVFVSL